MFPLNTQLGEEIAPSLSCNLPWPYLNQTGSCGCVCSWSLNHWGNTAQSLFPATWHSNTASLSPFPSKGKSGWWKSSHHWLLPSFCSFGSFEAAPSAISMVKKGLFLLLSTRSWENHSHLQALILSQSQWQSPLFPSSFIFALIDTSASSLCFPSSLHSIFSLPTPLNLAGSLQPFCPCRRRCFTSHPDDAGPREVGRQDLGDLAPHVKTMGFPAIVSHQYVLLQEVMHALSWRLTMPKREREGPYQTSGAKDKAIC